MQADLFTPLELRETTIPNRLMVSPSGEESQQSVSVLIESFVIFYRHA